MAPSPPPPPTTPPPQKTFLFGFGGVVFGGGWLGASMDWGYPNAPLVHSIWIRVARIKIHNLILKKGT